MLERPPFDTIGTMNSVRSGVVGFLVTIVVACTPFVRYQETNSPPHPMQPKASAEEVEVLTGTTPTRATVEVGVLKVNRGPYDYSGMPNFIARLRQKAAEIGCDVVVIVQQVSEEGAMLAACHVYSDVASSTATPSSPAVDGAIAGSVTSPAATSTPAASGAPRDRAASAKAEEARSLLGRGDDPRAESLALGTLDACGDKCSGPVKARLWLLVGVARCRRDDQPGARDAFKEALAADPSASLDETVANDRAKAEFFAARAEASN